MIIQHNLPAMNAHRNLGFNNGKTAKNLEKLSSGFQVNRAADSAAGLAISEKMRGQIRGLSQAARNVNDGISFIKTADGALSTDHAILHRMRELLVQASNGTYTETDRSVIQKEIDQLVQEIDDVSYRADFNGYKVLRTNWVEKIETSAPGKSVPVVIPPHYNTNFAISYGYIDVPANCDDFWVNFDNLADVTSTWPDLHIKDPNGKVFGYISDYLSSGGYSETTAAASCDKATYSGYAAPDGVVLEEKFEFTKPMAGRWEIILRNEAGHSSSFNLNSNLPITPYTSGSTADSIEIPVEPGPLYIHCGANSNENVLIPIHTVDAFTLGLKAKDGTSSINAESVESSNAGIVILDAAINRVSEIRADLGAMQNRLEHTLNNLGVTKENLQAAESSIRDVDMAKEMMEFTKNNILSQSAQAMLAQTNQLPQGVLQLLR